MRLGDLFFEGDEDGNPDLSINLLTVASTGNAAFLDELLRAGLDPNIGDSKGRTPLVCFHWSLFLIHDKVPSFYWFIILVILCLSPSTFLPIVRRDIYIYIYAS